MRSSLHRIVWLVILSIVSSYCLADTALDSSDPVTASDHNVTIANLRITSQKSDKCAITINRKKNVTIKNIDIFHANIGICAYKSPGLKIENVRLSSTSAPEKGPHCRHGVNECITNKQKRAKSDNRISVDISRSSDSVVKNVDATGGSSAFRIERSPETVLSNIVCRDVRGPYPRGQCVQFDKSDHSILSGFYAYNVKEISYSEDNVNIFDSDHVTVSNGLIDGNWSINGAGVIADKASDNAIFEDIDILNTGVSAVSLWSNDSKKVGKNFVARNIRVKNTHCSARFGGKPSSDGLVVASHPDAVNPIFENIIWFNHCRKMVIFCRPGAKCHKGTRGESELINQDFAPRDPLVITFPWESP